MELDQRTEIVQGAGRPLLRKWALSPAGALALSREADRLERARHPGVVALVAADHDHLDLEWAGAETLALARLTRGSAARILTAVATTVSDLHDLGIVHGRIDETHVVIGPELQPRLCGLRGSDPGCPEPGPADDVADLGLLLKRAIGMSAEHGVVPDHRWRAWPRSGGRDRALEAIIDRATDPDPARRPTARALARSLAEVVPDVGERLVPRSEPDTPTALRSEPASKPQPDPERRSDPEPSTEPGPAGPEAEPELTERVEANPRDLRRHPPATKVTGARLLARGPTINPTTAPDVVPPDVRPAAEPTAEDRALARDRRPEPAQGTMLPRRGVLWIGLLVFGGGALALRQPSSPATDPSPAAAAASVSRAIVEAGPPSTTATSLPPPTLEIKPSHAVHGSTVEFDGSSYQVGRPGDHVAVDDWDCDGSATVGLVRPSTGELFLFDGWPGTEAVTVEAVARVPGAQDLVGTSPGEACTGPEVLLLDGRQVSLPAGAGP